MNEKEETCIYITKSPCTLKALYDSIGRQLNDKTANAPVYIRTIGHDGVVMLYGVRAFNGTSAPGEEEVTEFTLE